MIEFLKEMTIGNVYLWFHMLVGAILVRFYYWLIPYLYKYKSYYLHRKRNAILLVFVSAIIWEIIEAYIWGWAIYGNDKVAFADALGDVLGAVIMAILVIL